MFIPLNMSQHAEIADHIFATHFYLYYRFSAPMVCMPVLCTVTSMIVWFSVAEQQRSVTGFELRNGLDCNRKLYKFTVINTDSTGRRCSDEIEVMSCWGRCDSNEVRVSDLTYVLKPMTKLSKK